MSMRAWPKVLIVAAVVAQVAVLAWMAGEREWILRSGQVVFLRTAPIDPRDLFRGDFVRLQYDINSVPSTSIPAVDTPATATPPAARAEPRRHEVVYTRLQPAGEGVYEAAGASSTRPADGVFLRGRTEDGWRFGVPVAGRTLVKYGIEQYFVEQGKGVAIEARRGTRNQLQVPMEVEVAVGRSGTGVIRGYRWSKLGMQLEVVRRPAPRRPNAPPPEGPLSPKLRVTLANASDAPIAVVDFGDRCAFHLLPVEGMAGSAQAAAVDRCATAKPVAADLITLAPGQAHSVEIDLADPRWFVLKDGKRVELGTLQAFAQYRIEYRAPPAGELADAANLWRGRMVSQAFNAAGAID